MIDFDFIGLMFKKYSRHLQDVVTSIETMIDNYNKQIESLQKLDQKKYGNYLRELENKKAEAFKKLAQVSPNIQKMYEQLDEIQQLVHTDVGIN